MPPSCLHSCLKQWILTNQQKLNFNEDVTEPVLKHNNNSPVVTNGAFELSHFLELIKCHSWILTILSKICSVPREALFQRLGPSAYETCLWFLPSDKSTSLPEGASWALTSQFICSSMHFLHRFEFMHCRFLLLFSGMHLYSLLLILTLTELERA